MTILMFSPKIAGRQLDCRSLVTEAFLGAASWRTRSILKPAPRSEKGRGVDLISRVRWAQVYWTI